MSWHEVLKADAETIEGIKKVIQGLDRLITNMESGEFPYGFKYPLLSDTEELRVPAYEFRSLDMYNMDSTDDNYGSLGEQYDKMMNFMYRILNKHKKDIKDMIPPFIEIKKELERRSKIVD
tara:strand:+ start:968 stop:1330 length:363 start_codon:yes stop_codon:yes gene_type:complete